MKKCLPIIAENERLYTSAEVERVRQAYEFIQNDVYPAEEEAISLLKDGNVYGLPLLTRSGLMKSIVYRQYMQRVGWLKAQQAEK